MEGIKGIYYYPSIRFVSRLPERNRTISVVESVVMGLVEIAILVGAQPAFPGRLLCF
jgi:hypothetical protein